MSALGKNDHRYPKWRERVRVWRKSNSHSPDDPMPITPDELEELEDIFPPSQHFVLASPEEIVMFGTMASQQFVVIRNGTN